MAPTKSNTANDPPTEISIGKTVPWRHNGRRTVSTGLAKAYYACYLEKLEILETTPTGNAEIRLHLEALGERDLPSPGAASLFCWLDPDRESWEQLAQRERELRTPPQHSRFVRGEQWVSSRRTAAAGYCKGYLSLPRKFLDLALQSTDRRRLHLAFAFGATVPWKTEFSVVPVLQISAVDGELSYPATGRTVPPREAWSAVFPPQVLRRIRAVD